MTPAALDSFRRWRPLLDGLAAGVHPLRWSAAGIGAGAAATLTANPRARRLLSLRLDWMGGNAPGNPDAWPDWAAWEDADPAALLPGAELERCGLRFGASLFRRRVAMLVMRKDVAAFKAAAGTDAYFFALRQALLAKKSAGASLERVGEGELPGIAVRAAGLGLAAWLGFLPAGLAFRVALKLPPSIDAAGTEVAAWPEAERAGWREALAEIVSLTVGRA
ncbi:MAG: Yop proteins translocation protein K [Planctomycetota bacterium]|jgi:hypothetical protein|nr:Yop proteins translocation protein K [Planctomycetota bacterium]